MIDVRRATLVKLKPEGGLLWDHDGKSITIIPDAYNGMKKVTFVK